MFVIGRMFPGLTAETYVIPGEELTQGRALMASREATPEVSLVLGAGNKKFSLTLR